MTMISRTLCALLVLCGAMSASASPLLLVPAEMDAVVAGTSGVLALAGATGDYSITQTAGTAVTAFSNPTGQLGSVSYVAGSEGVASAVGLGSGATTSTNVTTAATVPGTMVTNYAITQYANVNGFEVSGGAVMSFGSYSKPLF
jgi:hypothetical protein